jgi:Pentapeptide repeats (9 copies)
MAFGTSIDWLTCRDEECIGVRLTTDDPCWAHADPDDLDVYLDQLGRDGRLDGRGVTLTADVLQQFQLAIPRADRRPTFSAALFTRATFRDNAGFDGAIFEGPTRFRGAIFEGNATFMEANFKERASFDASRTWTVGSSPFGCRARGRALARSEPRSLSC